MAVHPVRPLETPAGDAYWSRLTLLVAVAVTVGAADLGWKAASLASGRSAVALDTPTTALRPALTLLVAAMALAAALRLPTACFPGALLVLAGTASNLTSLMLWHGVPDPLHLGVGAG